MIDLTESDNERILDILNSWRKTEIFTSLHSTVTAASISRRRVQHSQKESLFMGDRLRSSAVKVQPSIIP